MGGAGTDVALESADIALMADDFSKLPFAVGLSRAARSIIRQNLAIALGVIGLHILSSLTGFISLGMAIIPTRGVCWRLWEMRCACSVFERRYHRLGGGKDGLGGMAPCRPRVQA